MATPIYLGVDIAGASNTWVAALAEKGDRLAVVYGPRRVSLEDIVNYCETSDVVAVAIDAQLTAAISEENGFRTSDSRLQSLLPEDCWHWVMSANSLQAVPVRGRLLAEHLAPTVGTIIETHPRASLLFGLGHEENQEEVRAAIRGYKRRRSDNQRQTEIRSEYTRKLWRFWSERFGVSCKESVNHDGALDAIVCATVAHCFHHEPEKLHKLRHEAEHKVGRGPFYVVAPAGTLGGWNGGNNRKVIYGRPD